MSPDQVLPNLFLAWVCCGWPAVVAFVAVNVSRYGALGWLRRIIERAKAGLPAEGGSFGDG